MKKVNIVIIVLIILQFSCTKDVETIPSTSDCNNKDYIRSHPQQEVFQMLLDDATRSGLVGASLYVNQMDRGEFLGNSGFSSLETQKPITRCSKYRIASLTKTVLATAILLLESEGLLNLNTPIRDILSEDILMDIKRAEKATVQQLLNHSSGIANYDDNSRFPAMILNEPGGRISLDEKLELIRGQPAAPDEIIQQFGSLYSNSNYLLLQLILEKVSGQTYEEFIYTNILNKIGLTAMIFSTQEPYPEDLVKGYVDFFDNNTIRDVSEWDAKRFDGEGSLIASVSEVFRFYDALFSGNILDEESLKKMMSGNLGLLKLRDDGIEYIGHDGVAIGYSAEAWYSVEKRALVILLANQGRISDDQPSIQKYEELLLDIFKGL
ncbi:MAG: serine hydrolase domain-containing protein [Bacteroidota bacterium]